MECAAARELISARVDDELPASAVVGLDRHVAACDGCRRFEADVAALHRSLRLRPAEAVPDLVDTIVGSRAGLVRPLRRRPGRWTMAVAGGGAAAAAIVGVLVVGRRDTPAPPELVSVSGVAAASDGRSSTAAYVTFVNDGGRLDLTGASSAEAGRVRLHATDQRDGMTFMSGRDRYEIGGDGTTVFAPGGAHLMLEGLQGPLRSGERIAIVLTFDRADPVTVDLPVVDASAID